MTNTTTVVPQAVTPEFDDKDTAVKEPVLAETVAPEATEEPINDPYSDVDLSSLPQIRDFKRVRISEVKRLNKLAAQGELAVYKIAKELGITDIDDIPLDTLADIELTMAESNEQLLLEAAVDRDDMDEWLCEASERELLAAAKKVGTRLGERLR